jgi:hypothetical protein
MRAAVAWLDGQSLLLTGLAAVAVLSLAKLPQHISQDTWLSLVDGRYIAAHGIPHHDSLFVMTHGTRWIDQQWLSQLALYGVNQMGGLALYGLVYVAMTMLGFGLAMAAARALGGSERHLLSVLPLTGVVYFAGSFNVRTQGFALPLFSATLWLLAREIRGTRDRRVYLVFPLLILWGNLHGSATLGAGLAMLCGAVLLVEDLRGGGWRAPLHNVRLRSALLLIASPVCLLINPYGFQIVTYYRETILNPAFGKLVTEWQPITSVTALAVPFFLLALGTVWVIGRSGRRMPLFDQLTLILICAGAIFAIRNITWFGLAVTILLPCTISAMFPQRRVAPRRTTINLSLAGVAILVLAAATASVASKPATWFERSFNPGAASTVAQIAHRYPAVRFYSDNRFADWLLWQDPSLIGRIAYDIRFELLTRRQLQGIVDIAALPRPHEASLLTGYRVLVLDPGNGSTTERLLARNGTHVVLRSKDIDVAMSGPPS